MEPTHRIAIVGGGFAGAAIARRLLGRLPPGWEVMLLSEESTTTYNPLLPEVVGAAIFPEHVVAPLRQVVDVRRGGRFVMGRVTRADLAGRVLTCETLAGEQRFAYDHLVLAVGTRARLDLIPGMAEHAVPLKTVGDALHIRNLVLRRIARIELETEPARRRQLGHFVVIGGGFSGVEVAGALSDCLKGIARYYPGAAPDEMKVTLLQDLPRLLPELPERLGAAALGMLRHGGVEVQLGAAAARIGPEGVTLKRGETLAADTVVATIGTRPNALLATLGLVSERGRVCVEPALRVRGHDDVWACGDCALVPNAHDGSTSPPTAQFAVRQARQLADNLLAVVRGAAPRPFAYRPRGMLAAVGHLNGVAALTGLSLRGLPAWLLWRAYYLSQMPTFGRKLRIFVEWSWGMLFPPDITHIRFARSIEQEPLPVGEPERSRAA
ncbi:NAD(P)/FAD-dependent oxidoreductase [Falsiroseomonas sp. HW251]|uniref:NAD(P)/FAD-dependent oxidoreductase n=1 Tax=Falsiroseomonas sp. HW251 TaxID=3390998 RepID=UPI003D31FFB6